MQPETIYQKSAFQYIPVILVDIQRLNEKILKYIHLITCTIEKEANFASFFISIFLYYIQYIFPFYFHYIFLYSHFYLLSFPSSISSLLSVSPNISFI